MRATVLLLLAAILNAGLAQNANRSAIITRIGETDVNRNVMVTKDELIVWRSANFKRFNRNADSPLSDNDMPVFVQGTTIGSQFKTMKSQFDHDRDNKATRDQFVNRPTLMFDLADADHDSVLTKKEINVADKGATR
jgi:hypothetical protein